MSIIKKLFCNHTSQRCLTKYDLSYIDNKYNSIRDSSDNYTIWRCERCGKIIKKKILTSATTFDWINITIKNNT